MTQEDFKLHQLDIKAAHAALVAECQAKIAASKKLVKERLALLRKLLPHPPLPTPIEKRRKAEAYDIQRAIKKRICTLDKMRGWDVEHAEVKFNNSDDLLIFEVAIPKTQEQ